LKKKISESGKDGASWRRWTSAFGTGIRLRGFEIKSECIEAGQHGEATEVAMASGEMYPE